MKFTRREIEVIKLLADDKTNIQIADKLYVTESTVFFHVKNLLIKTKSASRIGIVAYAFRNKLIE